MKSIWGIFKLDICHATRNVIAVIVSMGLVVVPALYAWFNILSNWDPYGTASTSRISVAVASEDAGCEVLMPWGAPIGSGLGLANPYGLRSLRAAFPDVPLVVDAGIGPCNNVTLTNFGV